MTNKILLPLVLSIILSSSAFAESVITLKDGSQIKGEMVGLVNGVYTLKTPIIGDVHVNAADVVNINANGMVSNPSAAAPQAQALAPTAVASTKSNLDQQVQAAQTQLMNNPQAMMDLQAMVQDPEIAQMLSDPQLVQAVTAHDTNAVVNNAKVQALMQNPKMRAFIEKIRGNK